jgi:hypothetical protein
MFSRREAWLLLLYGAGLLTAVIGGEWVFGIPHQLLGGLGIPVGAGLGVHLVHRSAKVKM